MRAPDWLTARPVAHRGRHDRARGIIENMPAAASAAVAGNFAIECDIQLTADGEAMVHHDDALGRLTEGSGALLGKTSAELKRVVFKDTPEKMMSLGDLCAVVAGRTPLVIEICDYNEQLDVRVNGSAVHYETGWVGCNHNVVPSWGAACSFGQGRQTPFHLQHL